MRTSIRASDVYSLGIIFYELLAGVPPIDLRKIAFDEFLRRLREDEPSKPSTRVRTQDPTTSTEVAGKRRTEPGALAKQMRGDLDSIALKALEKERARRYGSPSDFAADIGRYLRNEAVLAVPPSLAYRGRKFARRYRGALATAGAFALVLIVAAGVSIWQSIRATKQRDRADAEAAAAQAVNDFLQNDLLAQASAATHSGPGTKPDPDLKVRTALDRAAGRIGGKFERQPELEAGIRDTIGSTYMDLGIYPEAQTQLERALALYRQVLGGNNPKTLRTMSRLGWLADLQGRYQEAEALLMGALDGQRRVFGAEHPDTLRSMGNLAVVYLSEGKYAQAEAVLRDTVEIARRVLGPEHPMTVAAMTNLGNTYYLEAKNVEAEALFGKALEIQRRVLGPEHLTTLSTMNGLALAYKEQGKYALAEATFRELLDTDRHVLGPEHPATLLAMNNLGIVYTAEGKYAQAEELLTQANAVQRRVLGAEHPDTLDTLSTIAFTYQRQGQYALAETYSEQNLAGLRHTAGPEGYIMVTLADLALAYVSQGKFAEAEPLARQALDSLSKKQPEDWQTFRAESVLGASLSGEKKYAEAEPLLVEGYQGMRERNDRIDVPDRYHLDRAHEWLVQLYQAWGKPAKVAEWRKK